MNQNSYILDPRVIWNTVGEDAGEVILLLESQETRIFIVSTRTGAAVISRLRSGVTLETLVKELQDAAGIHRQTAEQIIYPLIEQLEAEDLVTTEESLPRDAGPDTEDDSLISWPDHGESPALEIMDLVDMADETLTAAGSFQGGLNNSQGTLSCWSGEGAVNNVGGKQACRPGQGYGFVDGGWADTPCRGYDD